MPKRRPKPDWMLVPRPCGYAKCTKSFLPKQKTQIYCCKSHKVLDCRHRQAVKGDVKIVNVCRFVIDGKLQSFRCSLESGHSGDHLIRVAEGDLVT